MITYIILHTRNQFLVNILLIEVGNEMSRLSIVYLKNKMVLLMTAGCDPKPLLEKCL